MVIFMERKLKRCYVMAALALLTLAAFFLRAAQPAGKAGPLAWVSVAVLVIFGVYARALPGRTAYGAANGKGALLLVLSLAAAVMTLACALLRMDAGEGLLQGVLLAAMALCWTVTALLRQRGKQVSVWFFMIPAVFFGAELVDKFRYWGSDPLILDYCYELLALIATMCATFHLGGFCFDRGQRRLTVFFSLSSVFFNGAALADASGGEIFLRLASVAWMLVSLCLLLRQNGAEPEK